MLSAVIWLSVFGVVVLLWSSARAAGELAAYHGRRACAEAGVQWLDHTAVLERVSLQRDDEGRLRWLRRYRFEFSQTGPDRQRGTLALLGRELQWIRMPPPPETPRIDIVGGEPPSRHTMH